MTELMPSRVRGKRYAVKWNGRTVNFGSANGRAFVDHSDRKTRRLARKTRSARRRRAMGRSVDPRLLVEARALGRQP